MTTAIMFAGGRAFVLAIALMLAGCQHASDPTVQLQDKEVVLTRSCVPVTTRRMQPAYPDTDAALRAAKDAAERYQLVIVGRRIRSSWAGEAETVIKGCP